MSSASFLGVLGVSFVLSFPPCLLAECTSGWNVTVRCVWLYTPLTDWLQNMVNTRKPQQPLRRQYKERLCHGCHTLHAQQQRAGHSVKTPSPSLPGGGRVCPGPLPERTQPWPGTAYGTGGMSRYRGWRERPQPAGHMVVLRALGALEREQGQCKCSLSRAQAQALSCHSSTSAHAAQGFAHCGTCPLRRSCVHPLLLPSDKRRQAPWE